MSFPCSWSKLVIIDILNKKGDYYSLKFKNLFLSIFIASVTGNNLKIRFLKNIFDLFGMVNKYQ